MQQVRDDRPRGDEFVRKALGIDGSAGIQPDSPLSYPEESGWIDLAPMLHARETGPTRLSAPSSFQYEETVPPEIPSGIGLP